MLALRILSLLLIITAAVIAADDTHAVKRDDGGYDFYDFGWSLMGMSVPNNRGAYDSLGHFVGWSEQVSANQVDYYNSYGIKFRSVISDSSGTLIAIDAEDVVHTIGYDNHFGGFDNFDASNHFVNSRLGMDYVENDLPEPQSH